MTKHFGNKIDLKGASASYIIASALVMVLTHFITMSQFEISVYINALGLAIGLFVPPLGKGK